MEYLFSSVVEVKEQKMVPSNGRMKLTWVTVEGLESVKCRLDLQFMRPGKDTPQAIVAGVIPDREGIMFCSYTPLLRAGMQIHTKKDRRGKEVVKGIFTIKEIPDVALDFSDAHHIEVKVIEINQKDTNWPEASNSIDSLVPPGP